MSRVRGSDHFHLRITRSATVASLCEWLGVEPEDLLAANPDLSEELLPEGRELRVPVSALALNDVPGDETETETSTAPESQDADTADEPAGHAYLTASPSEDQAGSGLFPDGRSSQNEAGIPETDTENIASEADVAVPADEDGDSGREASGADPVAEVPLDDLAGYGVPQERPSVPEPPAERTVTWRPFPKTIL